MANPWEIDWTGQGGGDPVIAPPDPYKQASEARAAEDQSMQRNTQAQQAERLDIARAAEQRAQQRDARDQQVRDQGFDATEGERKAAAFLLRALGSNKSYEATGVGPRSLVGQAARDTFPDATNYFTPEDRQVAESAQDEFIAASLRQDSGAAIPPEEMERQRRIYFPMPGDGPEVLQQKKEARARAIAGLEQSAGRLLENTLAEWETMSASEKQAATEAGQAPGQTQDEGLTGTVSYEGPNNFGPGDSTPFEGQRQLFGEAGATLDAAATLGKQGVTFGLSDEAAGVGGAIANVLQGENPTEGYTESRDAERAKVEAARQQLGVAGTALELAGAGGGIRNALGGVGRGLQAARSLPKGVPMSRQAIQGAMAKRAGAEGAAAGAVGGFGYGEGAQGSATNALIGAGGGYALGRGAQALGNRLGNRQPSQGAAVQQAADDLGIQPIPAVTGGVTTQRLTAGARQGFISDRPVAKAVTRMEEQAQGARDRIASEAGQVMAGDDAGEVVRSAANIYSRRTSEIGGRLYTRADNMAAGAKVPLPKAVQAADEEIAQIAKAPGGTDSTLYKDMVTLRNQMANGSFEVDGIRQFRTVLRNQITERGLRGSPQDAAFGKVLRAAEDDMVTGLEEAGKGNAAQALKTASQFWRKRVETIDEVLEPVLGKNAPKSGEQILSSLERLANPKSGNASRLRRLFDAMPKEEASSVRATVISRMGQPTPGAAQQGEGFSFNTFLTNWNNMSPRAKNTMFPTETRAALDKLATVSEGVKRAGTATNTSNTAGAIVSQGAISGAFLWLADPLTAVGAAGGQYMIGKLLASPRFARFLANAPKNPAARKAYTARLGNIAKAEPAIANEIGVFRRALEASNDNTAGRLAAEDQQAQ